ncbi:hypothetical protein MOQ72_08070 [Saccharopolyspora sp. K220]|uniref:MAB_1171c family putative transporter n=1 Tax=Saccharopolyspora soli TaxID=2926618 RepID=UPI001F573177|nr:MAB_1171c family putative transporter [Saccharopolyspora soli]MCI2417378.1 hypothetical protein [Saccharopolyspora soli]
MTSIVLQGVGIVAVLAAAVKLIQSRKALTPSVRYLCGAIGCVGLSAALVAPTSLTWVSTWEPMPNFGRLVANILAMFAAWCVHGLLAYLVHEAHRAQRVVRGQAVVVTVAAAAMVALLLVADIPYHPEFLAAFADRPAVAAYLTVFAFYIGWATVAFGVFLYRYIAQSRRVWLRAGLRTIQAGCVASAGWAVLKIVAAMRAVSGHSPGGLDQVAGGCAAACVALVAVGATMPVWGPVTAVPIAWARARYQVRRLHPLWRRLAEELPQITLPAGVYAQEAAQFALYRRVVEIRDAQLVLRSYIHPEVSTWAREATVAAGLGEQQAHQVVEAACLAAALDAHEAGHQRQSEPDETNAPFRGVASEPQAEARWLIQVRSAFEGSPIVATVRARARAELAA